MRKILFRGQMFNGAWIRGLPYKAKYGVISAIVNENEDRFVVRPETVGQFTGLTDKNGNRIFEGDIVKICRKSIYGNGEYNFYKVIWLEDWNGWGLTNIKSAQSRYLEGAHYGEVIGNIHDNPELLGE